MKMMKTAVLGALAAAFCCGAAFAADALKAQDSCKAQGLSLIHI